MMRLSAVVVLLAGATFWPTHLLGQTRDVPLAFTNVTVVDVRTGTALADMTVVVSDDRITAVGTLEEVEVPAGTQVIEGAGKYLIPGLWDMHAHTTTDRNTREIIFPLLIAHGITGIRSMAADCFETGEPNCEEEGSSATLASIHDVRRWRQEIAIGTLAGPRVVAGSHYVNSPGPGEASTSQYPGTAEHGREHARLLNERGVDFIKVYSGLSREAFFALADEANRLGLRFAGETPVTVRASEASDAGQRSIEHLGFGNIMEECSSMEDELRPRLIAEFENAAMGSRHDSEGPAILSLMLEMVDTHDPEKCAALAEQFVRNETWVVPTLMIMRLPSELGRGWREDPYARFLSPDERRYFEWAEQAYARDLGDEAARAPHSRWAREMTRTMHRAGVRMLAGSDAGETGVFWGIGLHQELELLVSAGLTQAEALRAATLGPAEFLGATDSLGTVEAGKMADLVLLDANPLEDITNTQRIAAVVANGRLIDRDALDAMLADAERAARSSSSRTEPDTVRYTLVPSGIPSGERLVWTDPPDVWHSRLDLRGSVLDTRVELDSVGLPVRTEITGMQPGREPLAWDEHFELTGDTANWSTPAEQGSDMVRGPGFYVPSRYTPPFTLHLLARALLQRPDHTLPILPKGEARLEALERRTIEVAGRSRTVRLHAVHGLDFAPEYIWLDEDGSLFADDVSILAGWDAAFPELDAAATDALAEHAWRVFGEWIPPARERPLVIHGARLFDPASRSVRDGMTVLVQEDRIHSVGADGSIEVPEGADVIDATGRTMLPGLWDMHVHLNDDFVEEMEVPLFVAAGVTTVRDLGSDTDFMSSIRRRAEAGRAIAPRILPALILYGPGAWPLGAGVGTMEEARAAVDRFAALGYVQVKFYNPVPPELAPVIIERARSHRMRVSGHIPNGLTSRQAMESGFDEIQHLFYARIGAAQLRGLTPDDDLGARMAAVRVGTDEWEEFVELLRIHEIVIDPTLAVVEESVGGRPPVWLGEVLHRFPAQAGRVALHGVGPDAPPAPLRERWDDIVANGPELVRALYEAGVPLVAGTDGPIGGFALHRELELYVEAGIPAPEVLHIATLGAARVMGMDDELGSIEPGKLADLILVDGDPTADISDIRRVVTVIKNGRVHDPAAIYRALGIADALVFSDTVHVAPPTGEETTDRASILAALERVQPGGTVLFAPGTYLVGELIPIATPRITMQGHPQGTTLRACEPDEYHRMELAVTDATGEDEAWAALTRCGMFMLTGGHATIRGFTFEYTRLGALLGCCHRGGEMRPDDGGYRIEENTFRNLGNGIRAMLDAPVPSVIRGNRFINVFHALSAPQASHLQFIDNELSVPEPHLVPAAGYPSFAVAINALTEGGICEHNLVSGNRIEGHPIAIRVGTRPGSTCRNNVIRDNTITATRVPLPAVRIHDDEPLVTNPADSTFFGVPVQLVNGSGEAGQGVLEDNVIEGNRLIGAQGLAILLSHASGNRVANNTIGGVAILDPFPGNVLGRLPEWSEANGSAIWVSPGSEDNEITGNIFDSVASQAVVLEGDRNRVELRSTSDGVRDLGSGNRVSGPDGTMSLHTSESRFVDVGGVRLHYLDFDGEGLPLVFVHSEAWDAHTFAEFAPRFADRSRVLAVTRPGYGESEAHPDGFSVGVQARSLVDFLDVLGMDRAVFAGNASVTSELTYLAEHHPERVAGLVYLTGLAVPWVDEHESDPTRAFEMFRRASPSAADAADRVRARSAYRPEFLRGDRPPIGVPALALVARSGTMGQEHAIGALALVGSPLMSEVRSQMPPSPVRDHLERLAVDETFRRQELEQIPDPVARAYFFRLAVDDSLQVEVQRHHEETILPAVLTGQEQFRRAFGEQLQFVRLDVEQVVGYEYRDSPELIEPHMRYFLERVARTEASGAIVRPGSPLRPAPDAATRLVPPDAALGPPPLLDRALFFGTPEISDARLSPDGRYITFRKPLNGVPNIWIKAADEPFEAARPLTADDRPITNHSWSPDGRYVVYLQDERGDEDFHVYAVSPSVETDTPTGVPAARDLTPMDGIRARIYAMPEPTPTEILIGLNDRDPAWHDVYRIDLETGARTLLIENTERIAGWRVDLEGNVRLATRTLQDGTTEILRVGEDGAIDAEPVYTCSVHETCSLMRFHPDGRRVYMVTNKGDRDLTELVLFDPISGVETLVERDPEGEVDFGGATFSGVTHEIILTWYVGDRMRAYPKDIEMAADLDFLREHLPDGDFHTGSRTRDDRMMLVTLSRDVDPGSVYLFDRDPRTIELLYESRPELPSEHLAEMRPVRYTARDGLDIPAYLVLPKGVEPTNLPVVIFAHGGPWSRLDYGYADAAQFLANRGYAVFAPNFRGSAGYGKAFLNAGNGQWGTGSMQHDLTDAARYLIDEGIADRERIAIMGGSYGGYAALAGITFTPDLYAAAVAMAAPSNLVTTYGSMPAYQEAARAIRNERMGNPETEEGRRQLEAQSPLNFAERITTPLLLVHGANDSRIPQREADRIVIALRDRDYPVRYLVAPDEGHGFRHAANLSAMYAAIEAFLAEHLGGRFQEDVPEEIRQRLEAITVDPASVTVSDPGREPK